MCGVIFFIEESHEFFVGGYGFSVGGGVEEVGSIFEARPHSIEERVVLGVGIFQVHCGFGGGGQVFFGEFPGCAFFCGGNFFRRSRIFR